MKDDIIEVYEIKEIKTELGIKTCCQIDHLIRSDRVSDELRTYNGKSYLFLKYIFQQAGLLTVNKVKVTDDLKIAKVYLSFSKIIKPSENLLKYNKSKHNSNSSFCKFEI